MAMETKKSGDSRSLGFLSLLLLLLLCAPSCTDQETQIDFPAVAPTLVITGLLIDGQQPRISIGKANGITAKPLTFRLDSSTVHATILEDGAPFMVLTPLPSSEYDVGANVPLTNGVYGSDSTVHLREGSAYQLFVEAEGFPPATSLPLTYTPYPLAGTSTLSFREGEGENGRCVLVDIRAEVIKQPQTDNYFYFYPFFTDRDDPPFNLFSNRYFGMDDLGDTIRFDGARAIRPYCSNRSTLRFSVVVAPQAYADFRWSNELFDFELGGLFSVPESVPQNIAGGFGYFELGSSYLIHE